MWLGILLADLGDKYDRYFTLEDVMTHGEVPLPSYHVERRCPLSGRCDTTSPALKSIEEELDAINRDNFNFRYAVDKCDPKIIHVIDDRLKRRSGYPMDQVSDSACRSKV